jgi:hypothetical protein
MHTENNYVNDNGSVSSPFCPVKDGIGSRVGSTDQRDTMLSVTRMVRDLNDLAHQFEGSPFRDRLFGRKHECCSVLLAAGFATVNGTRGNLLGLDLVLSPGKKVHCPEWGLSPAARSIARNQVRSAPCVAPLADRISPVQFQSLQTIRSSARKRAA